MRPLTEHERAYVELRKEIQRQDAVEAERMASKQLWKDFSTSEWCKDAAQAQKHAEDRRRSTELENRPQWLDRQAQAVAETFIDLDPT